MVVGPAIAASVLVALLRIVVMLMRRPPEPDPRTRGTLPPGPDDPRWGPGSNEAQVVGKPCARCKRPFILSAEARRCKKCDALVHKKTCAAEHRMHEHLGTQDPYR